MCGFDGYGMPGLGIALSAEIAEEQALAAIDEALPWEPVTGFWEPQPEDMMLSFAGCLDPWEEPPCVVPEDEAEYLLTDDVRRHPAYGRLGVGLGVLMNEELVADAMLLA